MVLTVTACPPTQSEGSMSATEAPMRAAWMAAAQPPVPAP